MAVLRDGKLVEDALRGDVDSFTQLCRCYYPAMVAIADAILRDRHLAEDAAQEAFATACRSLRSLRDPDRFAPWLASICRNHARDLSRQATKYEGLDEWKVPAGRFQPHAKDELDAVRTAIADLPQSAKEVIYLRYYDELSYKQMSTVLGISEQAVNGRLRRAKRAIAAYLKRKTKIGGRP